MSVAPGLHVRQWGEGMDVVFLHGWAMHSRVWEPVAEALDGCARITLVDLPGHGESAWATLELEPLADQLAALVPGPAVWVGWSLGGSYALELASRYPQSCAGLVLVAATPRFVSGPDWPQGVDGGILDQFADELAQDYRSTLQRFVALQARGAERQGATLKQLRSLVLDGPPPHMEALRSGLEVLRTTDLRHRLGAVHCPTLVVCGERDTLVPERAGRAVAQQVHAGRVAVIPGAGHAPFLSHPQEFISLLNDYLHSVSVNRAEDQQP